MSHPNNPRYESLETSNAIDSRESTSQHSRREFIIVPTSSFLGTLRGPSDPDEVYVDSGTRPSYPFLACLLFILIVLTLLNLDAVATPSKNTSHEGRSTSFREDRTGSLMTSSSLIEGENYIRSSDIKSDDNAVNKSVTQFLKDIFAIDDSELKGPLSLIEQHDSSDIFPTASFNLKGRYATFSIPLSQDNKTTNNLLIRNNHNQEFLSFTSHLTEGYLIDQGLIHAVLLSKPSVIHSVRLATIRIDLESKIEGAQGRKSITLSGLDLRDVSTLTFQGKVSPIIFNLPLESARTIDSSPDIEPVCNSFAYLRFEKYPGSSRSARAIETQQNGGTGDWGFDLSDFGNVGEWGRRSLSEGQVNESENFEFDDGAERRRRIKPVGFDIDDAFAVDSININKTKGSSSMNEGEKSSILDVEGIVISPNCGLRMVLSGMEIDLGLLANKVIHFAFFFVLKGLMEARFFISQVKYTDGGSSPQKVCFVSLGLHTCVDCFEAFILISEAISSSFMPSTFTVLATFKIIFLFIVEFRYLVLVLKARFSDDRGAENLSRCVKLNAVGTVFIIIWTIRLLPILPVCIAGLYLFWIPQIIFDAWTGNRASLSLYYIVGMSVCRLMFPLYLWGCPVSIFDGEIFKALPSAPNITLCAVLVIVVVFQVVLIFIQRMLGPRAFVPDSFLPEVYNYYHPIPKPKDPEEGRGYECVICMTDISYTGRTLVTTPCDHHFHDTCLQQWMYVKAECPTCRRPLPPFP